MSYKQKRKCRYVLSLLPMDDRCCDCGRRLRAIFGEKPRFCSRCGIVNDNDPEPVVVLLQLWREKKVRPEDGEFVDSADEVAYVAFQLLANRLRVVEAELESARSEMRVLRHNSEGLRP